MSARTAAWLVASFVGLTLCVAPASAQDGKPDASMAAKVSLAGVRPGMTKAEAIAAIKAFDPQLVVVEGYTSFGNGMMYTAPRFNFKPANTAYFSTLIVIERNEVMRGRAGPVTERDLMSYASPSTFGIPQCHPGALVKQPREKVTYQVKFTPVLNDPRVLLIDEQRVFCGHDVTVTSAIERLYQRYSRNVTRSLRIREDGLRVTQDTLPSVGNGGAFLEWRYTAALGGMVLRNQVEMPLMDAWGNYDGLGNANGGIAVHAEIRPTQDLAYMDSLRTLLWDDGAMARESQRKTSLYSELDRLGITIAELGNRQLTDQIRLDDPAAATPATPVAPPAPKATASAPWSPGVRTTLVSAVLIAPLDLSTPGGMVHLAEGTRLYRYMLTDRATAAMKFSEPRTWFGLDPALCAEQRLDCEQPVPVPNTAWRGQRALPAGQMP